jgi:GrpB-like predicted nucleotidyltransferase (UPF0157 family)
MLTFVLSDVVAEEAARVFAEHRRRIQARLPDVEIRHTGGTSVRGVLTSGDVDLQVRTDKPAFEVARDALSQLYEPFHLDVWHSEGAFYFAPGSQPAVEVALTVIGSLDDLHHGDAWLRIGADPWLIQQYNAMKRAHEGGSIDDYNAAKRAFFYDNFQL